MSFGSRLRDKRNELKITQPQLAKMLGVSQSAVGSWETDVNSPRATLLYDLFDILHCDANYLFQDETTFPFELTYDEMENLVKKYRVLDAHGKEMVDFTLQKEWERSTAPPVPATIIEFHDPADRNNRLIEYYRSASAGGGVFILGNEATEQIKIPDTPENQSADFAIKISGDSMKPDYMDGDIVLVSQKAELSIGDVGIFIINSKAYIKEYGAKELISRNPKSPNVKISEYDNIVCMGKVIGKL